MTDRLTMTFDLPYGYRVTFHQPDIVDRTTAVMNAKWHPGPPRGFRSPRHERKFFEAYYAARDRFFADIATVLGGSVLVVDADAKLEHVDRMTVLEPGVKH